MALNFPANPAAQTPINTYSPTSSPEANTTNNLTYVYSNGVWGTTGSPPFLLSTGATMTGPLTVPTLNADEVNTSSVNGGQLAGFRNLLHNGAMDVMQRPAGQALVNLNAIVADRWAGVASGTGLQVNYNHSVDLNPVTYPGIAGFRNHIRLTTVLTKTEASATNVYYFAQGLEANDCRRLEWGYSSAKPVTLTFRIRANVAGTYSGSLRTGGGPYRSYCFTYEITSADTWQIVSVTIPGDVSAELYNQLRGSDPYLYLFLDFGSATTYRTSTVGSWLAGNFTCVTGTTDISTTLNAYVDITGVQLEEGTVATPFEYRPFQVELELCQRYFQWVNVQLYAIAPTNGHYVEFPHTFVTEMRAAPTAGALAAVGGAASTNIVAYSAVRITNSGCNLTMVSSITGPFYLIGYRYPLSAEI